MRSRILLVLFCSSLGLVPGLPAASSRGTDFWLAMTANLDAAHQLKLFITGTAPASGTVEIPGLAFSQAFSVPANGLVTVDLPMAASMASGFAGPDEFQGGRGIHVSSSSPITVYGLNQAGAITDAYLGLPVDSLGRNYNILTYKNNLTTGFGSTLFAVVATQDNTRVDILPAASNGSRVAGTPYSIFLNRGEAYQSKSALADQDHTGTTVQADKPVAVFAGHSCVLLPQGFQACDLLLEQVFPDDAWGTRYLTTPFLTRSYDMIRVLARVPGTQVRVDGALVATLAAGSFYELTATASLEIEADQPVLVAQYSIGTNVDSQTGDPSMLYVPPLEQFLADYVVATPPNGFLANYINLIVPDAAVGSVTLDGSAIPLAQFSPIGLTGFQRARLPVSVGTHALSGPLPFGVSSYGFASANAYGYTGGVGLASVATVSGLSLTPKTADLLVGDQHCVTATAMAGLSPVAGVRIDFSINGAHSLSGFGFTDAAGQAVHCWTGVATGQDSIRASLGALSDTATASWSVYTPTITPTHSHTPTATPTFTPTVSATHTYSPTMSATPTITLTHTVTPTYTATPPPLTLAALPANPNPSFNEVWLPYRLGTAADVDIQVYTVAGEPVRHFNAGFKPMGVSEQYWDHRNEAGQAVASGIFLYRIRARSPAGEELSAFGKCSIVR